MLSPLIRISSLMFWNWLNLFCVCMSGMCIRGARACGSQRRPSGGLLYQYLPHSFETWSLQMLSKLQQSPCLHLPQFLGLQCWLPVCGHVAGTVIQTPLLILLLITSCYLFCVHHGFHNHCWASSVFLDPRVGCLCFHWHDCNSLLIGLFVVFRSVLHEPASVTCLAMQTWAWCCHADNFSVTP